MGDSLCKAWMATTGIVPRLMLLIINMLEMMRRSFPTFPALLSTCHIHTAL